MRYAYLTSEFLGAAAALQRLKLGARDHEMVAVVLSARHRGVAFLVKMLRRAGVRYLCVLIAVGVAYRLVQFWLGVTVRLRGHAVCGPSVARAAAQLGIPVVRSEAIGDVATSSYLQGLSLDLLVSVFFDQRLPPAVLGVPRLGGVNLHNSLLPEFAGCAPTVAALAAGRHQVGVSVHWMTEEFDAGDILVQYPVVVSCRDSVLRIEAQLLRLGVDAIATAMNQLATGSARAIPQDRSRRSYQSHPDHRVLRDLATRGWRLFSWKDFSALCMETIHPARKPLVESVRKQS